MGNTFLQKLMLTIAIGFVAAGMVYLFRHVVEQAFWESGEGWQESLHKKPARHK